MGHRGVGTRYRVSLTHIVSATENKQSVSLETAVGVGLNWNKHCKLPAARATHSREYAFRNRDHAGNRHNRTNGALRNHLSGALRCIT